MRRGLNYLILVVVTFYLALIYKSNGLIFLGYIEVFLGVLLFLYNLYGIFHVSIRAEVPFGITERGKKVPVEIKIRNRSIYPVGKISVQLTESYVLFGKKKKISFYASVAGRREGEQYSTAVIHTEWEPRYTGKAVIQVRKVRCFDLLGILSLPLPKKAYRGSDMVVVLPPAYQVPIEAGRLVREFAAEKEQYPRSGTEETQTERFEIRSYQPGDRIRSIHWKLSAKEDELMVRDCQPVIGCPVLFFLDISSAESRQTGRQEIRNKESFFSVVTSLSKSMVLNECRHYVIWYDGGEKDVMRYCVEKEEDVYMLLSRIGRIQKLPEGAELVAWYDEKYREQLYAARLVLNGRLQLNCNDEQLISYQTQDLEKSLASQIICL